MLNGVRRTDGRRRTNLVLLLTRRTTSPSSGFSRASFSSAARLSETFLIRGFASPPRDGFALIGKGSPHKQSRPEREAKVEHGICQRKNNENRSEKPWIDVDYSG